MKKIFYALLLIVFAFEVNAQSFDGALALEVCTNGPADCFRKISPLSVVVNTAVIYDDSDVSIEYGQYGASDTIQGNTLEGTVGLTKTSYKISKDIYYDLVLAVKDKSLNIPATATFSYKEKDGFKGVLSAVAGNVSPSSSVIKRPVFLIAPIGYKFKGAWMQPGN